MGKINNKTQDGRVQLQDKLLGSNKDNGATSNYSIESIIPIIFSKGLSNPDVTIDITDSTGNVIDDFNASPIVEISVQDFVVVHHSSGAFIFTGGTGIWGVNGGDIADSTMFVGVPSSSAMNGVSSVNTYTGHVTLSKSDMGLDSVDNTSDADKPLSTDTQAEFDKMLPLNGHKKMTGGLDGPTGAFDTFLRVGNDDDYIRLSPTSIHSENKDQGGIFDIIHESEEGTVRLSIEGVGASLVKIFEMSYGVAQYFVGLEGTTALFNDGVRISVLIPDLDDASPDTLITKEYVQDNGDATLRPASPSAGRFYFDTDLNKPIWYSGSSWVDATGATV